MKRILVLSSGGSASTGFVRSLRASPESFYLVGADCNRYYLQRSETDRKYLIPAATDADYVAVVNSLITREQIEFVHAQNDLEVSVLSDHRDEVEANTFLPHRATVSICQDKHTSYLRWRQAGLTVPRTLLIETRKDLEKAFAELGARLWLRSTQGAGGKGALIVSDFDLAKAWIDFQAGWGTFTAAACLEKTSVTWMSLWDDGRLVVAQGRKRLYWELSNSSPTGVTGVTGTGVTISDSVVDEVSQLAIRAVDDRPNGLFGVDLTYDQDGLPNPTEINIGRFFTTHHFFTLAGLNMPYIYVKLAYGEELPAIGKRINPLPADLAWIRGVDFEPVLSSVSQIESVTVEGST